MDILHFKKILLAEKEQYKDEQKENTKSVAFDNADHYYPEEEADQVEAHDVELSLNKNIADRIEEIDAALERIENKTYGVCQSCGGKIDIDRLNANPAARTHAACV